MITVIIPTLLNSNLYLMKHNKFPQIQNSADIPMDVAIKALEQKMGITPDIVRKIGNTDNINVYIGYIDMNSNQITNNDISIINKAKLFSVKDTDSVTNVAIKALEKEV